MAVPPRCQIKCPEIMAIAQVSDGSIAVGGCLAGGAKLRVHVRLVGSDLGMSCSLPLLINKGMILLEVCGIG